MTRNRRRKDEGKGDGVETDSVCRMDLRLAEMPCELTLHDGTGRMLPKPALDVDPTKMTYGLGQNVRGDN